MSQTSCRGLISISPARSDAPTSIRIHRNSRSQDFIALGVSNLAAAFGHARRDYDGCAAGHSHRGMFRRMLDLSGVSQRIGSHRLFPTVREGVAAFVREQGVAEASRYELNH